MKHLKGFVFVLLIALCMYGYCAIGLPYFIVLTSPNGFEDERLTEVQSLGRFAYGQYTVVSYKLWGNGESVIETNLTGILLGKGTTITVRTGRTESGIHFIEWVLVGNRIYKKTLLGQPEILAEAEKVLQLGRDSFAKEKKKLGL